MLNWYLCPKCQRIHIEGTSLTQVVECEDCKSDKARKVQAQTYRRSENSERSLQGTTEHHDKSGASGGTSTPQSLAKNQDLLRKVEKAINDREFLIEHGITPQAARKTKVAEAAKKWMNERIDDPRPGYEGKTVRRGTLSTWLSRHQ